MRFGLGGVWVLVGFTFAQFISGTVLVLALLWLIARTLADAP